MGRAGGSGGVSRLRECVRIDRAAVVAYAASLLIGLVALSLVGRYLSSSSALVDFTRFHHFISPTTLYYPTASQVATLADNAAEGDKIVVVVGGSSVMWGAGQSNDELWTRGLQRALGDRYRVLNLALPSGSPQEHGGVAFQFLQAHDAKVIYLTDLGSSFNMPDGLFWAYVYWEASAKGYLIPNPEAMPLIEQLAPNRRSAPALEELRVRGALDSVLYTTDLWNAVGYRWLFTVWSPFVASSSIGPFFTPRVRFPDPWISRVGTERYTDPTYERSMEIMRSTAALGCRTDPTSFWSAWESQANAAFPESLRQKMVVVRLLHATPFRAALTPDEQVCYTRSFTETNDRLLRLGYGAVMLGEHWGEGDYVDLTHPSASGGVRMVEELAPLVESLAAKLGYTE
jgi:hypothetical protein